jgi:hypothetical protein
MSTDRCEERWLRDEDLWSLSLEEWREELLLLDLCEEEEEDLCEEDLCEDEEDLEEPVGTSRMFSSRPVVGSVVDSTLGLWATW